MTDTPAPVAQPLSAAARPLDDDEVAMLRRWSASVRAGAFGPNHDEERLRWADDVARLCATLDAGGILPGGRLAETIRAEGYAAGLDAARSVPDNAALGAAWADAEAALPVGWRLTVSRDESNYDLWSASMVSPAFFEGENDDDVEFARGDTPTEALELLAIAARQRARGHYDPNIGGYRVTPSPRREPDLLPGEADIDHGVARDEEALDA